MFSQDFDGPLHQPKTKKGHIILYTHPINSTKRQTNDEEVWTEGITIKAEYHQNLYASHKYITTPKKDLTNLE